MNKIFCYLLFLVGMLAIEGCKGHTATDKAPEKTVVSFLKWYSENCIRLSAIVMINGQDSTEADSSRNYSVNFNGTEHYLSELKKSNFISDQYVEKWRSYFKKCEADFIKNPQNEGPPAGFDFDFVMWSQDIQEDLDSIGKVKVISDVITGNHAKVMVRLSSGSLFTYYLSEINDAWLIDEIENSSTL